MMIDFIYRLNDVLPNWPVDTRWSLKQVSDLTETSLPHVLQFLSEGLGKELDVAGNISSDEATEALLLLSKKMQPEIEAREKYLAERRQKAEDAYVNLGQKVTQMQRDGKWYTSFRTLSYFAGQYENDLERDTLLTICSEIIRSGIKAKTNVQEIGLWLQKAIAVGLSFHSQDGLREALDLLEAYAEYFLNEDTGKGPLIIGNLLAILEEPCARYEVWSEYKGLIDQLYPS